MQKNRKKEKGTKPIFCEADFFGDVSVTISEEVVREIFQTLTAGEGNDKVCRIGLLKGDVAPSGTTVEITGVDMVEQHSNTVSVEADGEFMTRLLHSYYAELKEKGLGKAACPQGFAFYSPTPNLFESEVTRKTRREIGLVLLDMVLPINLTFNNRGEYKIFLE